MLEDLENFVEFMKDCVQDLLNIQHEKKN